MSKTLVKTYLVEENGYSLLVLEKPDGTLLTTDVFNGGGYVTQLTFTHLPLAETIEQIHVSKGGVITAVNDLVATDNQSQVEPLKSAQSDPKRKANT